jgi:hypothetical protein
MGCEENTQLTLAVENIGHAHTKCFVIQVSSLNTPFWIASECINSTFLTISLVTYVADSNLVFISTAITMPIIVGSCVLVILPTFDLGTT